MSYKQNIQNKYKEFKQQLDLLENRQAELISKDKKYLEDLDSGAYKSTEEKNMLPKLKQLISSDTDYRFNKLFKEVQEELPNVIPKADNIFYLSIAIGIVLIFSIALLIAK